jgi:hypothetical protein
MKNLSTAVVALAAFTNVLAAGNHYRSPDDVTLPPISQRQIIGTWFDKVTRCTSSFEQVKKQVFYVLRCSDGSGGNEGREYLRVDGNKFLPKQQSRTGDYYVIQAGGNLNMYDRQGLIDTLPRHPTLRP